MGFVALLLALLIEQIRPLERDNALAQGLRSWSSVVAHNTDAGQRAHGVWGWLLVVGLAVVAVGLAEWALAAIHPVLAFALHVAVLYFTVGFRQFSASFTEIQIALAANDTEGARAALERWIRRERPEFSLGPASVPRICRVAIAHALVATHRHLFGPLFWYLMLPGAIGPVLYRAAQSLADRWAAAGSAALGNEDGAPFGAFAQRAYYWLDWVPVRLAAAGFAVVGNFEDAIYSLRGTRNDQSQREILLTVGGGALGLRLLDEPAESDAQPAAADDDALASTELASTDESEPAGVFSEDAGGGDDADRRDAAERRIEAVGLASAAAEAEAAAATTGAAPAGTGACAQPGPDARRGSAAQPGIDAQPASEAPGAMPSPASLHAAAGLVRRSQMLWILVFGMLTIASLSGR